MAGVLEQRIEELFGGFFFDEDALSEDISLDGLDKELEEHKNYNVLASILANGEKQRDMATMVEGNLGHIEQDLIKDYVEDNDNLVLLHDQIHDCDIILSQIGSLLSGFQVHIGSISSEIRSLQEKSLDLGVRLKNRKLVETKLAEFVEEIVAPPGLVNVIIDGEKSKSIYKNDVNTHTLAYVSRGFSQPVTISLLPALRFSFILVEHIRQGPANILENPVVAFSPSGPNGKHQHGVKILAPLLRDRGLARRSLMESETEEGAAA